MIFSSPLPDIDVPGVSVPQSVMEGFGAAGDKPAIIDAPSGRTLTYSQLATQVRRMAVGLRERGLRKGDVFAILLPNVPEYATTFLGVTLVGGVATTMNPLLTAAEIAHQLRDTRASFLLTIAPLAERAREAIEGTDVRELFVIGDADAGTPFDALLARDGPLPQVAIDPREDLLALPYSSGTSGLPKGVMLTHYSVLAQLRQCEVMFGDGEAHCSIAVAPFFHILGMVLILLARLKAGDTIVAMPRFDFEQFLDSVQRYRVTQASLVPPIVVALAKHPAVDRYDLSSLRWMSCGAAPLGADIEQACADRIGCIVFQGWGMSELSGAATTNLLDPQRIKRGSCGLLWPNMQAKIVDVGDGSELGPNAQGEIWIRGPIVMKGYLNNPEATRNTLLPDGWMRTGDIGSFDDDGHLHVVDRVKELIKYNAYAIAPAELEAVLVTHPAVVEAAVVASPHDEHGEVPKAYVVARSAVSADELIAYVAERVAAYKKVRRVEFVEAIPKSASGKLLRRLLVERERSQRR
ncbi:MAG TPA: AMP-binding protein [Burkholderiaceae bacterium]|nr:AMP-binding protein [Burkholderiaceae bacterium]